MAEDGVPVVLVDAEIAGSDTIGRMIVNIHQHCRLDALLPGVIAECLSQGMTADMIGQSAL